MNLKTGISIYSIPERSINTLIDFAEENNFDAVELWDSSLCGSNKKLSRYLCAENRDLSVHAPLLDLGDDDSYESNTLTLRNFFERAGQWRAKTVVLHTGIIKSGRISKGVETAKRVINSNIDLLEKYGILLCVENVGYLGDDLIRDFEQLAAFVDSFPNHLVGVVLDISHANLTEGVESGIELLGRRIKHIHLSDNQGKPDNHHMPIGKGNIDFGLLRKYPLTDNSIAIMEITPDDDWKKNLLGGRKVLHELKLTDLIST